MLFTKPTFYYIINYNERSDTMKLRIISGILLVLILLGSLLLSYKVFACLMTLVAALGYRELLNIKYGKNENNIEFIRFIGYISIILITLNGIFFDLSNNITLVIPILVLTIPIIFYNDSKKYNINDALYIFGIVYFLSFAFSTIITEAKLDIYKCIYIFLIAFITDTYAYIGGCLIGKHKLTEISPKKTIEGSIVGCIAGGIIGSFYYYTFVGGTNLITVIIMSFTLTILSEIGDLVFSSIKRYFNKKDYSNLIPGHGGILDRFDSVIFVSLGLTLILSII